METNDATRIIEALFFVAEQPVTLKMLESVFDKEFSKDDLRGLIAALTQDYLDRASALEVRETAGGWQLATKTELAPWIRKLFKDRLTYRLSQSAMETLSIIAYKQPITRGEIEEIRGVEVSAVIDTLMDRKLLRIVGRKETLGRPILFGTTPEFLRVFGLKRLEDLPSIDSLIPLPEQATDAVVIEAEIGVQIENNMQSSSPADTGRGSIAETTMDSPPETAGNDEMTNPSIEILQTQEGQEIV